MASVFATLRGLFVQRDASNNGTSPKGARLALGGLLARTGPSGTVQAGVLVDGMGPVVSGTSATGPMTYSVRPFVLVGKYSDAEGPTVAALDATTTLTVDDRPGTNSRIDLIWARQNQIGTDGGSGTSNQLEIGVTPGSVSGSPSAPPVPAGAVALATVPITSSTTTTSTQTFTQAHEWTAANGGVIPEAKGSRLGRVWDGTRQALVGLGLIIRGQSAATQAAAFMQFGEATITTGPFGDITISLERAFPVALLGVVTTDAISIGSGAGAPYVAKWRPDNSSQSALGLRVYQADTGAYVPTSAVRISYVAWGC